ncbi:ATP synthase subunit I [Thermosediminibacter litoriperuensis]|uniref:ATP synthase I subunit n=1 Tax=Thermosediminibacter litoriperuensis TaxID=291989 RepID=A0A5S5AZQ0_9FIRM|nr:ATP synthase subunit I [Thermosediminibacter litoriperuensis]TYP58789.1 ATP synthase I subunit [Thermosediminibacter litoriperuensis]
MDELRNTFAGVVKRSIVLAAVTAILALVFDRTGRWAGGLILGSFMSIFNFYLLYIFLTGLAGKSREMATLIGMGGFFLRFLLTLTGLIFAISANMEFFIATILGLMVIKIAVLSNTILGGLKKCSSSRG